MQVLHINLPVALRLTPLPAPLGLPVGLHGLVDLGPGRQGPLGQVHPAMNEHLVIGGLATQSGLRLLHAPVAPAGLGHLQISLPWRGIALPLADRPATAHALQ